MRFGVLGSNAMFVEPEDVAAHVRAVEEHGFESIWTADHVVVPTAYRSVHPYGDDRRVPGGDDASYPEPLTWLAYAAACTSRLRLGTGVLVLPQRNPLVLAKSVATLDRLSRGRVVLGVGTGWMREERAAVGAPVAPPGEVVDEWVRALRTLWDPEPTGFDGLHCRFPEVHCRPSPAQPSVPIVVGGHSRAAAERAGRLGDGFFTWDVDPAGVEVLAPLMRRAAQVAGRDPDAIELTAGAPRVTREQVRRYEDLGVTRIVVGCRRNVEALAEALF